MTAQPLFEDTRLQRMEQATLWLQRMHAATADERVVEAWLDWCTRDPLNQQAFDEIVAVWELSGKLQLAPPAAATPSMRSRRQVLAASVAALGATLAGSAWWFNRDAGGMLQSKLSSPVGRNSTHTLADGSVLELGGGTRVTVGIGARARRVALHAGELYVSVQHDLSRPFSVIVDKLQVIATGTAFNVLRTLAHTTVTVAEGSVKALYEGQGNAAPNVHVQSGQQLVHSQATGSLIVRQADPRNVTAWRSGWLSFDSEPLGEVIETVNRYTARRLVINDERVRALTLTGTAHIDRIESWVQGALPHALQVVVIQRPDGSRLISPRSGRRSD